MASNTMTLSALPEETIHQIVSYLDDKSLQLFSLSSKRFLSATDAIFLRFLKITILGRNKLQFDLDRWIAILERSVSFKHVHELLIVGYMPLDEEDTGEITPATEVKERFFKMSPNNIPLRNTKAEDDAWLPLAQFIDCLPAVGNLKFGCANQFPPALLSALHQRPFPSRCKLHLTNFRLRSLDEPTLDSHEHAIITSQCLFSIRAKVARFEDEDGDDYNRAAIFRIASGLAPNLKHVHIRRNYGNHPLLQGLVTHLRPPWKGFSFDAQNITEQRGSIASLTLSNTELEEVGAWQNHIDISKLRSLNIIAYRSKPNGVATAWLQSMQNYAFDSLSSLHLSMRSEPPNPEYCQAVYSFLRSLKPLNRLQINASLTSDAFEVIAQQHGSSLRHLSFECYHEPNRLDTELIVLQQLEEHCHLLERLTLNITRSKGDAREVDIYKRLGALPNLRSLTLKLNTTRYPVILNNNIILMPSDSSFDEFDGQIFPVGDRMLQQGPLPRNGHIRDHFINSAIDETLARSIFDLISAAAAKRRPSRSLEYIHIVPSRDLFGHHPYYWFDRDIRQISLASNVFANAWSWQLNPASKNNAEDHVKVTRETYDSIGLLMDVPPDVLNPSLDAIFRKVWPRRENDTGNWKEDWHSFPLSTA